MESNWSIVITAQSLVAVFPFQNCWWFGEGDLALILHKKLSDYPSSN